MEILPLADKMECIAELAQLHHAEWQHLSPSLTLQQRAQRISEATGHNGIPSIFIAVSESQLIGSAALVANDMDINLELSPWLAAVYVKETFRRQGVASALIARCEAEAQRVGVSALYLYTEFATKLYEDLGWRQMEQCEYKGVAVNVLCKQLP